MKLTLTSLSARHPAAEDSAPDAIRGITLDISAGEHVAIIGASGAGKTTLLHAIACALTPNTGQLTLDGINPWSLPRRALQSLRGRLYLAPQVPPLPPRQRVVTSVLAGALPRMGFWRSLASLIKPSDLHGAHQALAAFDVADKLFERVDRLSGGERQRVGLSRVLVSPASLWLIDEPLSALDPSRAEQAITTLTAEATKRGVTLITTLHQVDVALTRYQRVVGLSNGELAFDLPAAQVSRDMLTQLYAQHPEELAISLAPMQAPMDTPKDALDTAPASAPTLQFR